MADRRIEDMDIKRILDTIHQNMSGQIECFAQNAFQDGLQPPYKLQIVIDEKVVAEFAVEHTGSHWDDWTWDRAEYGKLVPLAVNKSVIVEFLLTPGGRHLLITFDFSHLTAGYTVQDRVI